LPLIRKQSDDTKSTGQEDVHQTILSLLSKVGVRRPSSTNNVDEDDPKMNDPDLPKRPFLFELYENQTSSNTDDDGEESDNNKPTRRPEGAGTFWQTPDSYAMPEAPFDPLKVPNAPMYLDVPATTTVPTSLPPFATTTTKPRMTTGRPAQVVQPPPNVTLDQQELPDPLPEYPWPTPDTFAKPHYPGDGEGGALTLEDHYKNGLTLHPDLIPLIREKRRPKNYYVPKLPPGTFFRRAVEMVSGTGGGGGERMSQQTNHRAQRRQETREEPVVGRTFNDDHVVRRYRQPGLLCTPRNFAQRSKYLGNLFWY
jgi:hypothetical protein